jgi:hypothetical protein
VQRQHDQEDEVLRRRSMARAPGRVELRRRDVEEEVVLVELVKE